MVSVMLDTSFLITLHDRKRPHHETALAYWRWFEENDVHLYLSSIVVSEYCVKGRVEELPLEDGLPLPFTMRHATKSAKFFAHVHRAKGSKRDAVKDDLKIIAQAHCEGCEKLLTDDVNTMASHARQLHAAGLCSTETLTLSEGFDAALLRPDRQRELRLEE
ncbi:MAG: hypothetical protein E1N59_2943 [Puniceicoccaceae bacterium 5H]|nr:MAG: hypothetical protein E1N59_2943 [Puniceicoccaceae bacterium 5H]